jgi:hypothetical protein
MNDFARLQSNLRDLKFSGGQPPCGFESRPRHHGSPVIASETHFQSALPAERIGNWCAMRTSSASDPASILNITRAR